VMKLSHNNQTGLAAASARSTIRKISFSGA
jgi:hypothetical protein